MKYSKVKNGRIYIGDARKIYPQIAKEDQVVITDPPYNIGINYHDYNDNMEEDDYQNLFSIFFGHRAAIIHYPEETIKYIVPELGIPNRILAWCYNSNISRQYRVISIFNLEPNFNNSKIPYKNPKDKRIKKLIEGGSKGTRCYDWFSDIQLVKNVSKEKVMKERNGKKIPAHPCQIPVKLIQRLIALCTTKDDIVVDPFMGVGATAIAAESMNRKWIGIELSQKYCELASERVKNWEHYVDFKFLETLVY
ncbi:MAG: DNA-methyltransferase [Candidatus Heimdallarchaeaceae archaeon]